MDENVLGNVVGSLINRNRDDWGGSCGGFGIWMVIFLFLVMGGGWNNRANAATTQEVAVNGMYNQIDGSLRSIERGQSALGYNTLDQFGRTNMLLQGTGNNLQQAIAENTFATKDCCCTTNRNVDGAKFELTRNIDALRYDTAQQTCAITTHDTANTQKVLDKLCSMENNAKDAEISRLRSDLQAAQLTLAQGVQTQTIVGALKPSPVPAYIVSSPYGNYNNGFAYNFNGTTIV